MRKYLVFGVFTGSKLIGEYEASTEDGAIELAESDPDSDHYPSLCRHCANQIEVGAVYKYEADEA